MSLLKAFNNHFLEFIEDVIKIFPENLDIITAKTFLEGMIKVNPKLLCEYWYNWIGTKYAQKIENEDIDFFINKDYNNDLANDWKTGKIYNAIENLRSAIKNISVENQKKAMKYVNNLTKLSNLYFNG
tara:strand:+ start:977 stop:1360 length:384 start_codon:yes stop_codon:yes gene_type:complete